MTLWQLESTLEAIIDVLGPIFYLKPTTLIAGVIHEHLDPSIEVSRFTEVGKMLSRTWLTRRVIKVASAICKDLQRHTSRNSISAIVVQASAIGGGNVGAYVGGTVGGVFLSNLGSSVCAIVGGSVFGTLASKKMAIVADAIWGSRKWDIRDCECGVCGRLYCALMCGSNRNICPECEGN